MKILITGASSGLGAEFARQYATDDNELILLARRKERLYALQEELQSCVKKITLVCVDVREHIVLQKEIAALGAVDMVILNAGVSLGHKENDLTSYDLFEDLYRVNLFANHAILEILLPKFQTQKRGTIVFISSLSSLFTMPTATAYASSKRALNSYAQGIHYQYSRYGIDVLVMLPGFIKSELTDKNDFTMPFLLPTDKGVARMKRAIEKRKKYYPFPLRFYIIIRIFLLLPRWCKDFIIKNIT